MNAGNKEIEIAKTTGKKQKATWQISTASNGDVLPYYHFYLFLSPNLKSQFKIIFYYHEYYFYFYF